MKIILPKKYAKLLLTDFSGNTTCPDCGQEWWSRYPNTCKQCCRCFAKDLEIPLAEAQKHYEINCYGSKKKNP